MPRRNRTHPTQFSQRGIEITCSVFKIYLPRGAFNVFHCHLILFFLPISLLDDNELARNEYFSLILWFSTVGWEFFHCEYTPISVEHWEMISRFEVRHHVLQYQPDLMTYYFSCTHSSFHGIANARLSEHTSGHGRQADLVFSGSQFWWIEYMLFPLLVRCLLEQRSKLHWSRKQLSSRSRLISHPHILSRLRWFSDQRY